jgi:hypothetical protein
MLSTDLIVKLREKLPTVRAWIETTLAAHRDRAVPVGLLDSPRLKHLFPATLFNRSWCVSVPDKPPFPPLSRMGLEAFAPFEAMPIAGITYLNTFFVRQGHQCESLYFHEMVHVVQWDRLGLDRFLLAYGVGLVQSGYRDSPLEDMAYRLQADFDKGRVPKNLMGEIQMETDRTWENVAALIGTP